MSSTDTGKSLPVPDRDMEATVTLDQLLLPLDDEEALHSYEAHPVPWWLALKWGIYLVGAATYLYLHIGR